MQKLFERKSDCSGCEACSAICPQGAIKMMRDEEGFAYPLIDEKLCTDCGLCAKTCPGKHSLGKTEYQAYAVRCNDENLLYQSTSGGAFSLIASCVLKEGGLVCGATFDQDFRVVHVLSDDVSPMRKSKYSQSSMGKCYEEMERALQDGKQVLFSGTPCQCHGVKQVLGKYQGLILVSLLCHGVLPPALWEEYKSWLEKNGKLQNYCWRDKRCLNDGHVIAYTVGEEETATLFQKDPWARIFIKNLALRPSCHECAYRFLERDFDFSIGDFWGIEKICPNLADGKGTSLVIAGSERALEIMQKIKDVAQVLEVELEPELKETLTKPVKETILRKFLFMDFARKGSDGCCDVQFMLKKYGF